MGLSTLIAVSASGGGRITPSAPSLTYLGSGTSSNGLFSVDNYSANATYTVAGGTLAYNSGLSKWVLTVSSSTGGASIFASLPKGLANSTTVNAYRHVADQTSVPYTQFNNPCNDCRTDTDPHTWSCGCVGASSGGGAWGDCICRGAGYSYWNDYSGAGYTWSGSDYTNGSGEWWKIA